MLSMRLVRWREQSNSLQQKCEGAVQELKEELIVHKKRVQELNDLLAQTKRNKAEVGASFTTMRTAHLLKCYN